MSERAEVPLPKRMELVRRANGIVVVRRWFGLRAIFLTAFAVAWDAFLVVFFLGMPENSALPFFLVGHVGVGLGMTYFVLASWLNRTYVAATGSEIAVRHGPIPWFGKRDVKAHRVSQLFSKERVRRSSNSRHVSYEVHARMREGKDVKLVSGLESSEQARFIEQELEKWLGIDDVAVAGELVP